MHEKIYKEILKAKKEGRGCVLVNVIDKKGSGPSSIGAKMLVLDDGSHIGTIGGGGLEQIAIKKAISLIKNRGYLLEKYNLSEDGKDGIILSDMVCGGNVMVFYEYQGAGYPVYIFGAGHVGEHVIHLLKNMDYFLHVIDPREDFTKKLRGNIKVYNVEYKDFFKHNPNLENAFVFVGTSSHYTDFDVLKGIYSQNTKPLYVGLLASNKKAMSIIEKLKAELDDIQLSNLYTPCGLDIGGATPFEIALSIVSEIQGLRYKKKSLPHKRNSWYI